ncbi:hypothetical protein LIER_43061 [Lithospermum erythrorhizon]|uniref:Reverse transcriptase RNase H-like domain-containing protein n=1 Tax=Lithospermum erythrorhizon TaxID=34254 RepID=A0AAV3PCL5_LITER
MQSPRTQNEVQCLMGRIIALTRFISRSGDMNFPFFKDIKKRREFEWTPECEESLQELKVYIQSPQLLTRPIAGDILRVMRGAETRYSLNEKLVYALIVAAQKLKPYSEAHPVEVITEQPLRQILKTPSRSEMIVKWAIEQSEFDLRYKPQTSIKARALENFMVECTHEPDEGAPSWLTYTTRKRSKYDIIIKCHTNVAACVTLLQPVHARIIKTRKNFRVKKL